MERLRSKIIGTPVVDDDVARPFTTLKDLIIDPESGKIIGLLVDRVRSLIVSPINVLKWDDVLKIHGFDDIIHSDEVLRVKNVIEAGTGIFHNKVFSKDGTYIGKVVDFSVDTRFFDLKKLYTAKVILGLVCYDSRIIPAKHILEILPDKIVVGCDISLTKKKCEKVAIEDLVVT